MYIFSVTLARLGATALHPEVELASHGAAQRAAACARVGLHQRSAHRRVAPNAAGHGVVIRARAAGDRRPSRLACTEADGCVVVCALETRRANRCVRIIQLTDLTVSLDKKNGR